MIVVKGREIGLVEPDPLGVTYNPKCYKKLSWCLQTHAMRC